MFENAYVLSLLSVVAALLVIVWLLILQKFEIVRKSAFGLVYPYAIKAYNDNMAKEKSQLFGEMSTVRSKDAKLRESGLIRVLELGAGPGTNFKFYPDNSQLIVVDPNEFFDKLRAKNLCAYPNIKLEKIVHGFGEDLSAIEGGSVDAVTATFVLCSVKSVEKVLQEIHRVLAPGGKYYFIEHGVGKRRFWQWVLQNLSNPIWKIITNGCQITKDTVKDIKNSGLFTNVQHNRLAAPKASMLVGKFLGDSVYGTAQKAPVLSDQ